MGGSSLREVLSRCVCLSHSKALGHQRGDGQTLCPAHPAGLSPRLRSGRAGPWRSVVLGETCVGLLSLPIHADSLLPSPTVQLAFGRSGRGTRNPWRVGGRVVRFLWGLWGWAAPCLAFPAWPGPHRGLMGPHQSTGGLLSEAWLLATDLTPSCDPFPTHPLRMGEPCLGPLDTHPGVEPHSHSFPDLSKELMDLRKMLKKRWVWAGPVGVEVPWSPPPAAAMSPQGSALASTLNTGREAGRQVHWERGARRWAFWAQRCHS